MAKGHRVDKSMGVCDGCKVLDHCLCPLHLCITATTGIINISTKRCMIKDLIDKIYDEMKEESLRSVKKEYNHRMKKPVYDMITICKE